MTERGFGICGGAIVEFMCERGAVLSIEALPEDKALPPFPSFARVSVLLLLLVIVPSVRLARRSSTWQRQCHRWKAAEAASPQSFVSQRASWVRSARASLS